MCPHLVFTALMGKSGTHKVLSHTNTAALCPLIAPTAMKFAYHQHIFFYKHNLLMCDVSPGGVGVSTHADKGRRHGLKTVSAKQGLNIRLAHTAMLKTALPKGVQDSHPCAHKQPLMTLSI